MAAKHGNVDEAIILGLLPVGLIFGGLFIVVSRTAM